MNAPAPHDDHRYDPEVDQRPDDVPRQSSEIVHGRWVSSVFPRSLDGFTCISSLFCSCFFMARLAHRIKFMSYLWALVWWIGVPIVLLILGILAAGNDASMNDWRKNANEGESSWRYETPEPTKVVEEKTGPYMLLWNLIFYSVWMISIGMGYLMRQRIRERLAIPAPCYEDCLLATFCGWCSMVQMMQQVKGFEQGLSNCAAPDILPAFQDDQPEENPQEEVGPAPYTNLV